MLHEQYVVQMVDVLIRSTEGQVPTTSGPVVEDYEAEHHPIRFIGRHE